MTMHFILLYYAKMFPKMGSFTNYVDSKGEGGSWNVNVTKQISWILLSKAVNQWEGGQKTQKSINVVCERPLESYGLKIEIWA